MLHLPRALLPIQHWTKPGARVWLVESPVHPDGGCADRLRRRQPPRPGGQGRPGQVPWRDGVQGRGRAGEGADPRSTKTQLGEAWADLGASLRSRCRQRPLHYSLRSLTDPDLLERAAALAARQMAEPSWPADIWQREREPAGRQHRESQYAPGHRGRPRLCRSRVRQPPVWLAR
jgi:zinc protease